jgi:hypothetical protein
MSHGLKCHAAPDRVVGTSITSPSYLHSAWNLGLGLHPIEFTDVWYVRYVEDDIAVVIANRADQ